MIKGRHVYFVEMSGHLENKHNNEKEVAEVFAKKKTWMDKV